MAAARATDDGDATRVTATRATDRDLDLRPIRPATDDGGDEVVRGGGRGQAIAAQRGLTVEKQAKLGHAKVAWNRDYEGTATAEAAAVA